MDQRLVQVRTEAADKLEEASRHCSLHALTFLILRIKRRSEIHNSAQVWASAARDLAKTSTRVDQHRDEASKAVEVVAQALESRFCRFFPELVKQIKLIVNVSYEREM